MSLVRGCRVNGWLVTGSCSLEMRPNFSSSGRMRYIGSSMPMRPRSMHCKRQMCVTNFPDEASSKVHCGSRGAALGSKEWCPAV